MSASSPRVPILSPVCNWRDSKLRERAYKERRADKRPVWVMGIDGSSPRIIEPLHYQTTIDGSRAPWGPRWILPAQTKGSER